jgi:hypothetical protein
MASLALLGGALAVGRPAPAQANTARANTARALVSTSTASTVPPGTNFLADADATACGTSAQGWDAVAIPGWQTGSGLPTVVRYGTPGFPKALNRLKTRATYSLAARAAPPPSSRPRP